MDMKSSSNNKSRLTLYANTNTKINFSDVKDRIDILECFVTFYMQNSISKTSEN